MLQISNAAQQRIHRVYRRMQARGKPHHVIVVACARELACFLWAAATAPKPSPHSPRVQEAGASGRSAAGTRDTAMSNTPGCHARS